MTEMTVSKRFEQLPVPMKLVTAGTAACFADFASFPLDTAKVRLQLQGEVKVPLATVSAAMTTSGESFVLHKGAAELHYRGIVGTIGTICREEGFRSLYNGLNAGLQRQMCFASIRLGMYEPVKVRYQRLLKVKDSRGGFLDVTARILAGLTTGGMAVMVAQPTDVVKVRFQAQSKSALAGKAAAARYTGTWQAYKSIFSTEGVSGLWRGFLPNIGRNAIVNVSEIVCYDLVKEFIIMKGLMRDNIPCHFTSAVFAGFCATLCASPIDVIKTRYMNSTPGTYRGAVDCAVQTFGREGPSAFYKGFWPSFSRLVTWNIFMWITYEQFKRVVVTKYDEYDGAHHHGFVPAARRLHS
ncbi:unnamed protein product [Orchesella dallaii]|uniref:Mitochondrial brown fat uncoupling protein 1 n=1 Tax=Orchesella dallaii TaxID=48710 RepID=A0ABP1Q3L9_9HEXA